MWIFNPTLGRTTFLLLSLTTNFTPKNPARFHLKILVWDQTFWAKFHALFTANQPAYKTRIRTRWTTSEKISAIGNFSSTSALASKLGMDLCVTFTAFNPSKALCQICSIISPEYSLLVNSVFVENLLCCYSYSFLNWTFLNRSKSRFIV